MPWTIYPPSAPPPVRVWRGSAVPDGVDLSDALLEFLATPGIRGRLAEVDGSLCVTVVASRFALGDAHPSIERVDMVLRQSEVLVRRRTISGEADAVSPERIEAQWMQTPESQRDASVLFMELLDNVIDSATEVLGEIRRRIDLIEERLLAKNPHTNEILSDLLELSHHLGLVRDGVLPLRSELRELSELREPVERNLVSPSGLRWLRSIEIDLIRDLPAALEVAESRIEGARAQIQGERSESTNRVVLLLTIITVGFYAPTLITGLYGMNVPLPAQTATWLFWSVVGLAGAFLIVAAVAINRLGLWGTFSSVLPGPGLSLDPDDATPVVVRRVPDDPPEEPPATA